MTINSELRSRTPQAGQHGLATSCAMLSGVMLLAYVIASAVGAALEGPDAWLAAGVAVGICWFAGIAALMITSQLRGPEMAMYHMLIGMLVRMMLPLIACLILYARGGVLVNAGLVYYVLVFYLVGLVFDTGWFLRQLPQAPPRQQ